jgi:hypothetical protein
MDILTFVLLHLCPVSCSASLTSCVTSWLPPDVDPFWLFPHDRYHKGHQFSIGIWSVPPAVADAALEQLGCITHKQLTTMHIILIPRLMGAVWWRLLGKLCPLVLTVPLGCPFWDTSHHDRFWLGWRGLCQVCGTLVTPGGGIFCANFLSQCRNKTPCLHAWCSPCPCYTLPDSNKFLIILPTGRSGDVPTLTPVEYNRYCCARPGDNLITPFQCDTCHFINIYHCEPISTFAADLQALKCIRRSNLDAFWAAEEPQMFAGIWTKPNVA